MSHSIAMRAFGNHELPHTTRGIVEHTNMQHGMKKLKRQQEQAEQECAKAQEQAQHEAERHMSEFYQMISKTTPGIPFLEQGGSFIEHGILSS